jgi:hypothetical protein
MPQKRTPRNLLEAAVAAVNDAGGNKLQASKALNMPRGTLENRLRMAEMEGLVPLPPQAAHGTSTLYGSDGQIKLQWVKSSTARSPDEWAKHIKDVFADALPVAKIAAPAAVSKDLLTVYPIGDHHVGMYAWGAEVGDDYDLKIAAKLLVKAMQHLVSVAPPSHTAIVANLGDFFHVDNLKNQTSRSGHVLDVDTRYAAMIRAGVMMLRAVIDAALTKHKQVRVICAIGNHDDIGALWLALALEQFYGANPRVEIDTSPAKFYYYRHGKVLLGVTHGDTGKPEKLQSVMAADRAADWGATLHRYWFTGHVHHRKVVEFPGVMWETFRTLPPNDAWAAAAGYRSGRDMTCITFHSEHGELSRYRCDITMLA